MLFYIILKTKISTKVKKEGFIDEKKIPSLARGVLYLQLFIFLMCRFSASC